jgi:hypothetical protein
MTNAIGDVEKLGDSVRKHGCLGFGKKFSSFRLYLEKVVISGGHGHSRNLFREGVNDSCNGFIHRDLDFSFSSIVKTHAKIVELLPKIFC